MAILDLTSLILMAIGYAVAVTDYIIRYRADTEVNRMASKRLGLPKNTPVGERPSDCMIGSTAIISHLLDGVTSRTTTEVHEAAETVLTELGQTPSWEDWITSAVADATGLVWHRILASLKMPYPRQLHYSFNNDLAGKGVLIMSNLKEAHAVAYAHGLVSDPSRSSDLPTWELLPDVLDRYGMVPTMLHIFEDCTDGTIGFVPFGAHRCTYGAIE